MRAIALIVSFVLAATASAASVARPPATDVTNAVDTAADKPYPTDDGGLKINVTLHVTCDRRTRTNDVISVAYNLTLVDGTKIESTKPGESFKFTLGVGEVIDGWDMGLKYMCIGERRTLTIPPEFGYGAEAVGAIPSNSTLIFYTELMGIDGVPNPGMPIVTPSTTKQ
ncbi:Peptidyl-prolyl cis-trans isomerase, FKBP-type [Niveomyces insectorum RCEF 264]|uniref:peptidylprolyl isomerase n=1 Tax=Niveomyces insectorum RCEF 264 TaxID=1081102 RepID=A0A167WDR3_9HYPO|nr:Peptidyl-prolyl cis-trans isomerase, FKBP-type [Niveomyces insectorum RCEF 264]